MFGWASSRSQSNGVIRSKFPRLLNLRAWQESARLVSVEPLGTRRLYLIRREGIEDLRPYLDGFWLDVLSAYGAEIARRMKE